jgi:hypothetical protein
MNLVDEQHIVWLQVREQRGEVAGALQHGPGRLLQANAKFVGHDIGECRLAKACGPKMSTWSSASLRRRAASMNSPICAFTAVCP